MVHEIEAAHGAVQKSLLSAVSRIANRLSFKYSDEFFHGMLSYRVRAEGPHEKGGNNLAGFIHDACCSAEDFSIAKNESSASQSFLIHALGKFGK